MTPQELIAWHKHQLEFLPDGDHVVALFHRAAIHCVGNMLEVLDMTQAEVDHIRQSRNEAVKAAGRAILELRAELAAVRADGQVVDDALSRVTEENDRLRAENQELRNQLEDARRHDPNDWRAGHD